jgi:DNA-binding MarR family transcriptional regulator
MIMDASVDTIAHEVLDIVPAIMRTIRKEMRSRRGADLSVMQFRALLFIQLNPGASLSAVAEYLDLTPPTVSKMVDGLVANDVVIRGDCSEDRRRVMLTLTAQGQNRLEIARGGTQARLAEILSGLAPGEYQAIHQVMQLRDGLFVTTTLHQAVPES